MRDAVLYYPYFEPRSDSRTATMLLWWDKLFLIRPAGLSARSDFVSALEHKNMVNALAPEGHSERISDAFRAEKLVPCLDEIARKAPDFSHSDFILDAKLGNLRRHLDELRPRIGERYRNAEQGRVKMDKDLGSRFMTFLAERMAKVAGSRSNGPRTDIVADGVSYLRYLRQIPQSTDVKSDRRLAQADQAVLLLLGKCAPRLDELPSDRIGAFIKFRQSDESAAWRRRFRGHVLELVGRLHSAEQLGNIVQPDYFKQVYATLESETLDVIRALGKIKIAARRQSLLALLSGGAAAFLGNPVAAIVGTGLALQVIEYNEQDQVTKTTEGAAVSYFLRARRQLLGQPLVTGL
jgi:hypothetical protein